MPALLRHPQTEGLESEIRLVHTDGVLVQRKSMTLPDITEQLADATDLHGAVRAEALQRKLTWVGDVYMRRSNTGANQAIMSGTGAIAESGGQRPNQGGLEPEPSAMQASVIAQALTEISGRIPTKLSRECYFSSRHCASIRAIHVRSFHV